MAPEVLESILEGNKAAPNDRLLVGNDSRDDAAAFDLGNGTALISTTDFFMPIVDDPNTFGRVAAANALSDVYAMGGKPILAIGILGWPVGKIPQEAARDVVQGGRELCGEAGVVLGGGHSIDNPEPIYGLAVNGLVALENLKRNTTAEEGDLLYLTKGLGLGLLTTAEKRGLLREADTGLAAKIMTQLNNVGEELGKIDAVTSMTDVTGFGLGGHLLEMCEGSGVSAQVNFDALPLATDMNWYLEQKTWPGGTTRNFDSFGNNLSPLADKQKVIVCDPQTSGGLLIAVSPSGRNQVEAILAGKGLHAEPIGHMTAKHSGSARITVI